MTTLRTALPLAPTLCVGGGHLTVERLLLEVPGVQTAYLNLATEMAYVEYDPVLTGPEELFAVLKQAGFAPSERIAVRRTRP